MLEIRQVSRYTIARYPRGEYVQSSPSLPEVLMKRGAVSLVLLTLLEACEGAGGSGPPPVIPDMITENEARQAIEDVFRSEDLGMTAEVPVTFRTGPGGSVTMHLDGFNETVQVGYEYLYDADYDTFNCDVWRAADSLMDEGGPYVKFVGRNGYMDVIEREIEAFIDTLKAHGVI